MTSFVLASASPARADTLRSAGVDPLIRVSNVDENRILHQLLDRESGASPAAQVSALAKAKARAVASETATEPATAGETERLVVGCDSMLDFRGEVLGKPHTAAEATKRISELSGNEATLWTGHQLLLQRRVADRWETSGELSVPVSTVVHFGELSPAEIAAYVGTGEPLEVAGSFTIDGLGGAFLEGVTGDPHSVVGISLPALRRGAKELGVFWPDLWRPGLRSGQ